MALHSARHTMACPSILQGIPWPSAPFCKAYHAPPFYKAYHGPPFYKAYHGPSILPGIPWPSLHSSRHTMVFPSILQGIPWSIILGALYAPRRVHPWSSDSRSCARARVFSCTRVLVHACFRALVCSLCSCTRLLVSSSPRLLRPPSLHLSSHTPPPPQPSPSPWAHFRQHVGNEFSELDGECTYTL
jgi:hypothetical protein